MINKKLDEISIKLDTIKLLVQDNEYLENVEKRCDEVNEKYIQTLEVAQERFDRIQKAIEYIEQQHLYEIYFNHKEETHKLLDILRGNNETI